MRDLQTLRQRVAQAGEYFKQAEEDRDRESASLVDAWESVQEQFEAQKQEIARYRARIDTLVAANDELAGMIDRLIATVEDSAKRAQEEAVPTISRMVREALSAEPMAEEAAEIGQPTAPSSTKTGEITEPRAPEPPSLTSPVEHGVKSLIERIGDAVGPSDAPTSDERPEDRQALDMLRGELDGLRERLSRPSSAH